MRIFIAVCLVLLVATLLCFSSPTFETKASEIGGYAYTEGVK